MLLCVLACSACSIKAIAGGVVLVLQGFVVSCPHQCTPRLLACAWAVQLVKSLPSVRYCVM
jgi:hypothetical protein